MPPKCQGHLKAKQTDDKICAFSPQPIILNVTFEKTEPNMLQKKPAKEAMN